MTIVLIAPALLAGVLGLMANGAEGSVDYLPRLRFMLMGAAVLGLAGVAIHVWRRLHGWRRWGALLLALVAVRVCYSPVVGAALVSAGWLDQLGRFLGAGHLGFLVHYSLPCFVSAFSTVLALLAVAAAAHLRKVGWVMVLLLFCSMAVLAFWKPEDRAVSPHPLTASGAPPPSANGPTYLEVVQSGSFDPVTRIEAAGGFLRHLLSPRSGWGGTVRDQLLQRFRGEPSMGLRERISCLEAAMLRARRISPRTPRSSSARPRPGHSGTPR